MGGRPLRKRHGRIACLVLFLLSLCAQERHVDKNFISARYGRRGVVGMLFFSSKAEAARLIRDKDQEVYDPKTGQKVVPPCERTCNMECLAIVGERNDKNVAYCRQRCQDDCAAGDGLGSTESFDVDMPRVAKDSEKNPVERFAEWGSEMNVQMMDFMKPPGTTRGLEPDSMSVLDDASGSKTTAEAGAQPLFDARALFSKQE